MRMHKIEDGTGTAILIIVGLVAGIVSFTHVIAWTEHHGQDRYVGIVNAMITELVQIAAGLEIKRRHRNGRKGWKAMGLPVFALLFACSMSLLGQLSQAHPGWQGKLVATLPMIGFLITVKLMMGRSPAVPGTVPVAVPGDPSPAPVPVPVPMPVPVPVPVPEVAGEPFPAIAMPPVAVPGPREPSVVNASESEPSPTPFPVPDPFPLVTGPVIDEAERPELEAPVPVPHPEPSPRPSRPAAGTVPAQASLTPSRPDPAGTDPTTTVPGFDPDIVAAAEAVMRSLTLRGQRITRDRFLAELRERTPIRTDRGSTLFRHLREHVA